MAQLLDTICSFLIAFPMLVPFKTYAGREIVHALLSCDRKAMFPAMFREGSIITAT